MTGQESRTTPALSVVIPAFNAERTIGQQLEALSRQVVPFAFEILVCDNGSTDGTAQLVRDWCTRLPPLRLVDASARRGPSAARNVGMLASRSPLIAFCDADDVVDDDWLGKIYNALGTSDFVAGGHRYSLLNRSAEGPLDWQEPLFWKAMAPTLPAASANNLAARTSVLLEVGGFDETMGTAEDVDLCWRIQLAGHELVACPDAIVQVRRRSSLRSVFRQAYAWGAGDRALGIKYADANLAARLGTSTSSEPNGDGLPLPTQIVGRRSLLRRFAGAARRLRQVPDPNFVVSRTGMRLGLRFGPLKKGPIRY